MDHGSFELKCFIFEMSSELVADCPVCSFLHVASVASLPGAHSVAGE
jgi:hypothetical protein